MFAIKTTQKDPSLLQKEIDRLLVRMSGMAPESDTYAKTADQLIKLYKLTEHDAPKRVSPDQKAAIVGNLAGIVAILGYERVHIITTKAIGFVLKSR
jgi:hypothetical protein